MMRLNGMTLVEAVDHIAKLEKQYEELTVAWTSRGRRAIAAEMKVKRLTSEVENLITLVKVLRAYNFISGNQPTEGRDHLLYPGNNEGRQRPLWAAINDTMEKLSTEIQRPVIQPTVQTELQLPGGTSQRMCDESDCDGGSRADWENEA